MLLRIGKIIAVRQVHTDTLALAPQGSRISKSVAIERKNVIEVRQARLIASEQRIAFLGGPIARAVFALEIPLRALQNQIDGLNVALDLFRQRMIQERQCL